MKGFTEVLHVGAKQADKLSDQLKPQTVDTAHLQGTAEKSNKVPEQMLTVETAPRASDLLDSAFLQQIENCVCMHIPKFCIPDPHAHLYLQICALSSRRQHSRQKPEVRS